MRTIKFRGKVSKGYNEDFFKQKFVYGSAIICEDDISSTIINDEFEAEVDTDTIGQFTGLKDVNGIEIYEGDIVEYTQHHFNTDMLKTKRKAVEWKYDKWGVYETNAGESEMKVIGNIHETPELLTGAWFLEQ
jgi:uncharacterized phage protein (TIGR01671 family)